MIFSFKRAKKSVSELPGRGDLDNYCKAIFDALNKIVWKDDRQINELYCEKHWGEEDQIIVTVGSQLEKVILV